MEPMSIEELKQFAQKAFEEVGTLDARLVYEDARQEAAWIHTILLAELVERMERIASSLENLDRVYQRK